VKFRSGLKGNDELHFELKDCAKFQSDIKKYVKF
jgi:hypothetical protein